jgi:peroxiredoxin
LRFYPESTAVATIENAMRHAILLIFTLLSAMNLIAQPLESKLKVGDIAPTFSGTDQNGNDVALDHLLKDGPVVVIFYRGAWCPYCNKHLSHIQDSIDIILEKASYLLAVTPEVPESIQKTVKKTGADFTIIHDANYQIMDKYGLSFRVDDKTVKRYKMIGINLTRANGNEDNMLPVPATYIIGMDGAIKYLHYDPNYKNRSTVKEILEALEQG